MTKIRRQCAHGTAESPPRPRTKMWQPTWGEVGEKSGKGAEA